VIVASGYTYDPIITQYQDYGFCGALAKPFTMQELATVMQGVTGIIWSPVFYASPPKKVGNITL
jgi:hypothetical protein